MANAEHTRDAPTARLETASAEEAEIEETDSQSERRPEQVGVDELRSYLTAVEGKTATQRIMVGINHKEGVTQTELADWYDVSRTTIHNWLDRLERLAEEPLEAVVYDDDRPGRPSKLTESQQKQFEEVVAKQPSEAGYDAPQWTPRLAQVYIEEIFHVEYTLSYVRELLHEAGVSWDTNESNEQGERHIQEAFKNAYGSEQEQQSHKWMHGCRR